MDVVLVTVGGGVGDGGVESAGVVEDGDMAVGGIAVALEEGDGEDGPEHEEWGDEEADEEAFGADGGEVFALGDAERLAGG